MTNNSLPWRWLRNGPPSLHLARAKGIKTMHELHEPQAQSNPDSGDSKITSSVPNNSELLEFGFPPRRCERCGKPFHLRKHGGGSPQGFCNEDCRIAWHAAQQKRACTLNADGIASIRERPEPLMPRITEADLAAHRDFVAELGENPLWHEYQPDRLEIIRKALCRNRTDNTNGPLAVALDLIAGGEK